MAAFGQTQRAPSLSETGFAVIAESKGRCYSCEAGDRLPCDTHFVCVAPRVSVIDFRLPECATPIFPLHLLLHHLALDGFHLKLLSELFDLFIKAVRALAKSNPFSFIIKHRLNVLVKSDFPVYLRFLVLVNFIRLVGHLIDIHEFYAVLYRAVDDCLQLLVVILGKNMRIVLAGCNLLHGVSGIGVRESCAQAHVLQHKERTPVPLTHFQSSWIIQNVEHSVFHPL